MSLRPFFPYFGSKWSIASEYQRPRHDALVEPFAGSACYALHHHRRNVILVDASEVIAGLWRFLIRARAEEVLSIPDIPIGERSTEQGWCQEWEWLAGFWCSKANVRHHYPRSAWGVRRDRSAMSFWGESVRRRIAGQMGAIRHWKIIHGDYTCAPEIEATWFVDPPYQPHASERRGGRYPNQPSSFDALGEWCQGRQGQTIVCEMSGAQWLPFRSLCAAKDQKGCTKREVVWTSSPDSQCRLFALDDFATGGHP